VLGTFTTVALTTGIAACGSNGDSSSTPPAKASVTAPTAASSTTPSTPAVTQTAPSPPPAVAKAREFNEHKACDALTVAIAKQVVGPDATTGTAPPSASTSSVSVTNCSYYSPKSTKAVSILARSALDQNGATSNEAQFGDSLPSGATKVKGIGDDAYWNPASGQFNVLKHDNWYILTAGSLNPKKREMADAESYARLIEGRL
jgi:hypothetical protein